MATLAPWAHCWLTSSWLVTSTPRPFPTRHFPAALPQPVALRGAGVTQGQGPALGLVAPHTTGLGPSVQPDQIPLQSLPALRQVNTPTHLGVTCKLTEGALDPLVQTVNKDMKED